MIHFLLIVFILIILSIIDILIGVGFLCLRSLLLTPILLVLFLDLLGRICWHCLKNSICVMTQLLDFACFGLIYIGNIISDGLVEFLSLHITLLLLLLSKSLLRSHICLIIHWHHCTSQSVIICLLLLFSLLHRIHSISDCEVRFIHRLHGFPHLWIVSTTLHVILLLQKCVSLSLTDRYNWLVDVFPFVQYKFFHSLR